MLNYLVHTTRALFMAAIIAGVIAGYTKSRDEKTGKVIMIAGGAAGFVIAVIIAILRNNTSRVSSAGLNSVLYTSSLIAFAVFIIFAIPALNRSGNTAVKVIKWAALAVFLISLTVYSLPEVLMYPHQIIIVERTALSTDFLLAMIGIVFGIILCIVTFFAAMKCTWRLGGKAASILLIAEMAVLEFIMISGVFSINLQNGNIKSNHTIFSYVVFVKNHNNLFVFLSMAILIAGAVVLFIRSSRVNEPYRNPAEHRKIRAKWRSIRKWAACALVAVLIGTLNLTVVDAMNSREVALSPIEECEIDDENMYVTFEQVADGHLHRFAYETENGAQIRVIVIKKPNSQSYGIGLDACDICGETGYYEKDGQVVCKLCDVVMNISTIGFKGGCNPIVIPYEIKNGKIIIPISGLMEYEKEFK